MGARFLEKESMDIEVESFWTLGARSRPIIKWRTKKKRAAGAGYHMSKR